LVRAACEGLVRVKVSDNSVRGAIVEIHPHSLQVDQLEQRAVVSYALRRQVTRADWKVLAGTLDAWAGNIDRLLAAQSQAAGQSAGDNAVAPAAAT
jgi:hypothetical protein